MQQGQLAGSSQAGSSRALGALQLLPAHRVPKGNVLSPDPIVKDQARMGSSSMPGGSTPVSSASMMSGQFHQPRLEALPGTGGWRVWEGELWWWAVHHLPGLMMTRGWGGEHDT